MATTFARNVALLARQYQCRKLKIQPANCWPELACAFLRQTYYLRIGALRKKRELADIELKKLQELRQKLIEKKPKRTIYSKSRISC